MPAATKSAVTGAAAKNGANGESKKKPAKGSPKDLKPVKPEPTQAENASEGREIQYEKIQAVECIGEYALTESRIKELLGWEDEDQYKERTGSATGFGDEFFTRSPEGKKVKCWNNTKNRPFALAWAKAIAQDILHSGPGLPEHERRWQINGEPIIIGQYGQFLSGQHRGIGLIWAVAEWNRRKDFWSKIWPTEPVLETIVIFGIPETQAVIRTMDNVRPRSLSDIFYTSEVFSKYGESLKREGANRLAKAVDFVWRRTAAGRVEESAFQTMGESVAFLDRHPKIIECVEKTLTWDKDEQGALTFRIDAIGRGESGGGTPAGAVAGMLYLMGATATDPMEYISGPYARSEKALDWAMWDKAVEFWDLLIAGDESLKSVRDGLTHLKDPAIGAGGKLNEQVCLLARAWSYFASDSPVPEDIHLEVEYEENAETGERKLSDTTTIGGDSGIDFTEGTPVSPEDVQKAKEEEKRKRIEQMEKAARGKPSRDKEPDPESDNQLIAKRNDMIRRVKEDHPGKIVLYPTKTGYSIWGNDATYVGKVLKWEAKKKDGMDRLAFNKSEYPEIVKKLLAVKAKLLVWHPDGVDYKVEEVKAG